MRINGIRIADISPDLPTQCNLTDCKVAIVGEAPGADEVKEQRPFVGRSGKLLRKIMTDVGLFPELCFITNVFLVRPPDNNVMWFFDKTDKKVCLEYPPFDGKYVQSKWADEIDRLHNDLYHLNPKVIVGVGRIPLWALLNKTGITNVRGVFYPATGPVNLPHIKVMPTFHPSYCLRNRKKIDDLREDLRKVVQLIDI